MTARKPLPEHLAGRGFSVGLGRSCGVADHRMRAGDLVSPFWGVRAPADARLSLLYRCRLLGLVLPGHAFFSG